MACHRSPDPTKYTSAPIIHMHSFDHAPPPCCRRVEVIELQMLLRVLAFHYPLHHPSISSFVPQSDAQVHKIPTCNYDKKKHQHFGCANREFDHRLFSWLESNKRDAATPYVGGELPVPLVERFHLQYFW